MTEKTLERILSSVPIPYAIILLFGILLFLVTYKIITTKPGDAKRLLKLWWLFSLEAVITLSSFLFCYWWLHRPLPWSPNAQLRVLVCGFSKTAEGRNVSEGLLADLLRLLDSVGLSRAIEIRTDLDATPTQNADATELAKKSGANAVVWGYVVPQKTGQLLAYPNTTCLVPECSGVYTSERPIAINLRDIKQTSPTMQLALIIFEQLPLYKGTSLQVLLDPRNEENYATNGRPEPGKQVSIYLMLFVDESLSSGSAKPGQAIKVAMFVRNNSDETLKNLKANHGISSEVGDYVHGSAALNGDLLVEGNGSVEIKDNQIKFNIDSLEPQERMLLTYWQIVRPKGTSKVAPSP